MPRDAGTIVIGWLVKIALVLAVFGVCAFDTISISAGHMNAEDDANTAASAAAFEWHSSHNIDSALRAAQDAITNPDETVLADSLTIDQDGTAHLKLRRKVSTLVAYRIGPLKKYTVFTVDGGAAPPSS